MPNMKLVIAYDGTDFHGFARQKGLRTIQGTLEDVISSIAGKPVEVFGSGRTDAGVHARAQVVNFQVDGGPPPSRYPYILRRALPKDIVVVSAETVEGDFHARFSALKKTYRYTLQRNRMPDVFTARYVWHFPWTLDVSRMETAAGILVGEHDFTSFCAASTPIENKVRTIYDLHLEERDTYLDIYCTGSGFLQNMVRILVGTLTDVGQGRIEPSRMGKILEAHDRQRAGQTAPACGLTLWQVYYPGLPLT